MPAPVLRAQHSPSRTSGSESGIRVGSGLRMPTWGCGYSHQAQLVSSLLLHVPAAIYHRNLSHHGGSFHPNPQATAAALPCLRVACYKASSGESWQVEIVTSLSFSENATAFAIQLASLLMDPGAIDVHAHQWFLWHATPASDHVSPPRALLTSIISLHPRPCHGP